MQSDALLILVKHPPVVCYSDDKSSTELVYAGHEGKRIPFTIGDVNA
jgi:hypothetical protein